MADICINCTKTGNWICLFRFLRYIKAFATMETRKDKIVSKGGAKIWS